ncbi:DUF5000 domain-containing lipoprotein [Portibacter lacus]|nr:DUF5000 domain-containing lipoprotein [Portibacter lacus]
MKKLIYWTLAIIIICSCSEDIKGPTSSEGTPPGKVVLNNVENSAGKSIIDFTSPQDEDLLYVKATYVVKGVTKQVQVSKFESKITVEGFPSAGEYDVELIAVDLSGNSSETTAVKVNPTEPEFLLVAKTITMIPTFGGIIMRWENLNNAPLEFLIYSTGDDGLEYIESHFSGVTNGEFGLRGFDNTEKDFGVIVRDRWNNESELVRNTLTPLKEARLDKALFEKIILDDDNDMDAWEGLYEYAYDDNITTFNHTWAGSGWPQKFTIDLGVTKKLSRFILTQRQSFPYSHGNPRLFEIWGTNETPAQDGSMDNWVKLKDCVASKPSLEGGTADEDQQHLIDGDEYNFALDVPAVKYVRLIVNETWGQTGFIHVGELTFFGQE